MGTSVEGCRRNTREPGAQVDSTSTKTERTVSGAGSMWRRQNFGCTAGPECISTRPGGQNGNPGLIFKSRCPAVLHAPAGSVSRYQLWMTMLPLASLKEQRRST